MGEERAELEADERRGMFIKRGQGVEPGSNGVVSACGCGRGEDQT